MNALSDVGSLHQPSKPGSDKGQVVSASDLVRNFGKWRDRAIANPVYIHLRGEPRLVLTSVETMTMLCEPTRDRELQRDRLEALSDAMREIVIVLDPTLRIEFVNRAARTYFAIGRDQAGGRGLMGLGGDPAFEYLHRTAFRVQQTQTNERVQIQLTRPTTRHLSMALTPFGDGVALCGQDTSLDHALDESEASLGAVDQALAHLHDIAKVRINQRGYTVAPTHSLAQMTGLSLDMLRAIRFGNLLSIGTRVDVLDAVERVFQMARPETVTADLMVHGTEQRAVQIALAPILSAGTVTTVQAVILAQATRGEQMAS